MATLKWYYNRVRKMSAAEISWRLSTLAGDQLKRVRYAVTGKLAPEADLQGCRFYPESERQLIDWPAGFDTNSELPAGARRVIDDAKRHCENQLTIFGLDVQIDSADKWHYDFKNNVATERKLAFDIDYRNVPKNGDCKFVWEPARHHQLVRLGMAARLTGDEAFARAVPRIILDWMDANPYGFGMHWRSPLELGVRLINWVWAIELIRPFDVIGEADRRRILEAVYRHVADIASHYSRGSSANNHLIGEAAGVFVAASYFDTLPGAKAFRVESLAILEEEIERQSYADGCTREHALGYQFFVLQFYLYTAWAARYSGEVLSARFQQRLDRMIGFVETLASAGPLTMFGDKDDGYVLDLGDGTYEISAYRSLFDVLFGVAPADENALAARLFPGQSTGSSKPASEIGITERNSVHFDDSGYALLQNRQGVSVFLDVAPLGYGSIAAHGHADALSLTATVGGRELLVDGGTFDYFSYPEWRNYFRSTAAHNTVEVDGQEQSVMSGPFMWEARAAVSVEEVELPETGGGRIVASHDGYERLTDPVTHRRGVELVDERLTVTDEISCNGRHRIHVHFHVAECWSVERVEGAIRLRHEQMEVEIDVEDGLEVSLLEGKEPAVPGPGWRSHAYHQRTSITTIRLSADIDGATTVKTRFRWSGLLQRGD